MRHAGRNGSGLARGDARARSAPAGREYPTPPGPAGSRETRPPDNSAARADGPPSRCSASSRAVRRRPGTRYPPPHRAGFCPAPWPINVRHQAKIVQVHIRPVPGIGLEKSRDLAVHPQHMDGNRPGSPDAGPAAHPASPAAATTATGRRPRYIMRDTAPRPVFPARNSAPGRQDRARPCRAPVHAQKHHRHDRPVECFSRGRAGVIKHGATPCARSGCSREKGRKARSR